jgi:hypothetical protein
MDMSALLVRPGLFAPSVAEDERLKDGRGRMRDWGWESVSECWDCSWVEYGRLPVLVPLPPPLPLPLPLPLLLTTPRVAAGRPRLKDNPECFRGVTDEDMEDTPTPAPPLAAPKP